MANTGLKNKVATTWVTQWDTKPGRQYLEYGPLPQQAFRQVLPGQLSGGLQLLVPISSLKTNQHKELNTREGEKNNNFTFIFISLMCFCVQLCPPVQVCAPHNPGGRCRRPQLGHSPWRGPPAELSSCTPGKAWPSSQTGVSGPCSKTKQKKYHLQDLLFPVLLFFVHLWQFNSNLTMNDENHRVLAIFPYLKFCFPVVLQDFGLLLPDHILNVKDRVFT